MGGGLKNKKILSFNKRIGLKIKIIAFFCFLLKYLIKHKINKKYMKKLYINLYYNYRKL
jgi:hypothetical protein